MAPSSPRIPLSYDEITRNTVAEPDSSYRPTKDQERAAIDGERILSADEATLHAQVSAALRSSGIEAPSVTVEIDGTRATLRGQVSGVELLPRLEAAVHTVPEISEVVDLVVVAAST